MYYAPVHQIDNNNRPIFLYTNGTNQERVCVLCVNYYTEINHGLKMCDLKTKCRGQMRFL